MNDCPEADTLTSRARRGALTPAELEHIDTCAHCARRVLAALMTPRPEVLLEDEVPLMQVGWASDETVAEVDRAVAEIPALAFRLGRRRRRRAPRMALIGATLAAAAAIAVFVFNRRVDDLPIVDPPTEFIARGVEQTDLWLTLGAERRRCRPLDSPAAEEACPWRIADEEATWWFHAPYAPTERYVAIFAAQGGRLHWLLRRPSEEGTASARLVVDTATCEGNACILTGGLYPGAFESGRLDIAAVLSTEPLDRAELQRAAAGGPLPPRRGHVRVQLYRLEVQP